MEYIQAFLVGGAICALAQILLDRTKMLPGRIMVLLVCSGAVLSFLGAYDPFAEFAGAGASVPLLGFGNLLFTGVKEALQEKGDNPVNQRVGYIMSGDPTYITSHKNARSIINKVERDEIIEALLENYIDTKLR